MTIRSGKIAVGLMLAIALTASADTMQSSNYKIQQDSMNAGGIRSTSATYAMEDTVGEQATGYSSSTSFNLKAGYQQMNTVGLALTGAANVTLTPALQVYGGGTSTGSLPLTATTDNTTGYQMSIKVSNNPAMQSSSATISNYTPVGADPDFTFITPLATAAFAFSPEGTEIVQKYKDNGAACNIGALDTTGACWNLLSTVDDVIATRATANNPLGTVTTLKFQVAADASTVLQVGSYIATTTVTLIAL